MRFHSALMVFAATLVAAHADSPLSRFTFDEPHMGTRFRIILYAPSEESAHKAAAAAFKRIADLDATMSDYRPASELMRLCAKSGGDPVHVSDELFFVLSKALETSRVSDGAFDVTVGPVVKLWRIARRTKKMPAADKLAAAMERVGWRNVVLDEKSHTVQLLKGGMLLDLGGIAKGYAADEGLATLKKEGVTSALVAAGGDIAVSDAPPNADGWKIAIAPLEEGGDKEGPHMVLHNAAVSTSGDAEQYVEIDGKRYSHIVDPKTGLGLVGRMSATVTAPHGIIADSHTKIIAVLGPEYGFKILAKEEGVSGRFVSLTDDGREEVKAMKSFPQLK